MLNNTLMFAQDGGGIGAMIFLVVYLGLIVLVIAGFWMTFEKAGKPGWMSIIPILNIFILVEISGKPTWWVILYFIPLINLIAVILVSMDVAKQFGKSEGFGLGLAFLPFIFYPMIGFGDATYGGGKARKF